MPVAHGQGQGPAAPPKTPARPRRALGLALLALLAPAGCATVAPPPPPLPAIVLQPPPAPVLPPVAPPAVSRALKRDSAAVQQRARAFIAPPSVTPDTVHQLDPLTNDMNRRLAIMELHHTRRGYRPIDVRAARTAADAVARFLNDQQPPAPAAGDEPP